MISVSIEIKWNFCQNITFCLCHLLVNYSNLFLLFRFIIVGSVSLRNITNLDDNYRTNESVTPNPRSPLDDYSLHIVNIDLGVLTDTKTFHYDKIYLSHNQGLYLYKTTLAVLSVQHQTIHIFDVSIFIFVRNFFMKFILISVCSQDVIIIPAALLR